MHRLSGAAQSGNPPSLAVIIIHIIPLWGWKTTCNDGLVKFYKTYKLILTSCKLSVNPLIVNILHFHNQYYQKIPPNSGTSPLNQQKDCFIKQLTLPNAIFGLTREKWKGNPVSNLLQWCALFLATRSFTGALRSRVRKRNTRLLLFDCSVFVTWCLPWRLGWIWHMKPLSGFYHIRPCTFFCHKFTEYLQRPPSTIFARFCNAAMGHWQLATGMPYIGKWEQAQYRGRADPRWICRFSKSHTQLPLLRHPGNCCFPLEEGKRCKNLSSCGQACKSNETITKRCGQLKRPLFCDPWGRESLWPLSLLVDYALLPPTATIIVTIIIDQQSRIRRACSHLIINSRY